MKVTMLWAAAAAAMLMLAGCNKAESPEKVQRDVAKATADAEKKDERAAEKEDKADAAITNDVVKDVDKANQREVDAAANDAMTQAEGENKIALAKCEALAGNAQKTCKDQANAELKLAKERAKAVKSDRG